MLDRARRVRPIALAASVVLAVSLATCGREVAGPPRRAGLSVSPVFPSDLAAFNLSVDSVRLIVVRPPSDTVLDKVFAFPANQPSLSISASVPLEQSSETFQVTIQLLSGTTALFEGSQAVTVTAGETPQPAPIPVGTYIGPGQNVASLTMDPPDSVLTQGGTLQFRLTAKDAQGAIVPTFYASWSTSNPAVAAVGPTGALTAPFSRATVTVTARTPKTASQPNGVSASTLITFVPTPNTVSAIGGCPQSGAPGVQLPQPFVVQVNGADNQGVRGVRVQFSATSGGGSVSPASDTTNSLGQTQALLTLGAIAGPNTFQASVAGVATAATCTATALGATQLAFTTQPPASVVAGSPFSVAVTARDGAGSPVTTFTGNVTLTLGTNPGGVTFTQTVAAVSGVATFANVGITKVGVGYTLVASASGLASATSTAFDITPGPTTQLAFSVQPSTVGAGSPITPAVVVVAQDAFGNLTPSFTGSVAIAIGANPGNGTLGGTPTQAAAAGVATFADLTIDKIGSGYTLVASSTGLTNAVSTPFTVAIVELGNLVFTTQPTNVTAGSLITPGVIVKLLDSFGNVNTSFVGAVTIAIGNNPSAGVLSGTLTVNAVAGVATFGDLSINKAGSGYTLVANSSTLPGATSTSFNVTPGAATQLAFTQQPPPTLVAGTGFTIVVTAQDNQGNTATTFTGNVSLAFGSHPAGAVLGGTTTVAAAAGVATFSNLGVLTVAGGYTLVASSSGFQSVASISFTVTPAAAAALAFTTEPSTVSVGAVMSPAVQVAVQDAFANTVTSATDAVTLSLTVPNGANLGGTLTRAAASGVATFTGLTVDKAGTYTLSAVATGLTGATSASFTVALVMNAWANGAGGAWSVAGNWSQGRVPSAADSVVIALAGTYTVTLDTTVSVGFLTLGATSGTQTLALSSRTLTVSGAATIQNGTVATVSNGTIASPVALTNLGRLTLVSATMATAFVNGGTLVATGPSALTGSVTTNAGDSIIVQGNGTVGAGTLTVTGGSWTNNGAIVLTDIGSAFGATLTVPTGTLTNATGRTIEAALGASGDRTLNATLINQGTLTVGTAAARKLTIAPPSGAASSNSGTITVNSGLLQITQTGTSPSFTNPGAIQLVGGNVSFNQPSGGTPGTFTSGGTLSIGSGRTLTVTGGVFTVPTGAAITGTGILAISGATANVTPNFNTSLTGLTLATSTWNGPGILTNPSGVTLDLQNSTIAAPFVNGGTLVATGPSALTGSVTTNAGDSIIVQGNGTVGAATLTVSGGSWTNNGAIVLTDIGSAFGATLTVPTGTLTNATGRTIEAPLGASGDRTLNATLINQGTVTVGVAAARKLTIAPPGGTASSNSATITVNSGQLQITETGTSPAFTNSGTIQLVGGNFALNQPGGATPGTFTSGGTLSIGGGRTLTVTGGVLTLPTGATITGTGILALSGATANVTPNFNTSLTGLTLASSTWNGPGILTNPAGTTLNLQSSTIAAPFVNGGALVATGQSALTGSVTTNAGDSIIVQGNGTVGAGTLTVSGGSWTNNGAIVLTDIGSAFGATLTVTAGTLTNAVGQTIEAALGANGDRTLNATVDNQGTLTVGTAAARKLTIAPPGGGEFVNSGTVTIKGGTLQASMTGTNPFAHNSGTIDLSGGDFTLSQPSAASAGTFASTGTLQIGTGRTFSVSGGVFQVPLGATITGAGTLVLSSDSAAVTPDFSTGTTGLRLTNSVWLGSGILTNAAGATLNMQSSEINSEFVNEGTLVATGTSVLSGVVTTAATSVVLVQGNGTVGAANLHVTSPVALTNNGVVDLTSVGSGFGATLVVDSGFVNAAGGKLEALPGAGGPRALTARLVNQAAGTVTVSQALTMDAPSAGHNNAGLIRLSGGDLSVVETGTRPGIGNFGTIDVGGNKMTVSGTGSFVNQSGGILRGSGGTFDIGTPNISFITNGTTIVGGAPGAGTLNWVGTYLQGPDPSVFQVDVGGLGTKPGVDYDQFVGTDNVTLQGGTLNVNLTGPVSGQTYVIIQLPAGKTFSGDFQVKNIDPAPKCAVGPSGNQYLIVCP